MQITLQTEGTQHRIRIEADRNLYLKISNIYFKKASYYIVSLSLFPQAAYRGSVKPFVNFNAKQDAELLHKAMKGIGQLIYDEYLMTV